MDLLAVFFIDAEEAATAHWRFKRTGDFHHLIVVENVRVHALARALQRQLLDVIVRVAELVVQAVANGEYQFREYRSFAVFAQAGDAVTQDRLLNQAGFPAGAETKAKGDERRLPVGGMQSIDFVFQRLEGVVALFLGTRAGIAFRIRDLPLFGNFTVLVEAFFDERRQHFIDAVNGGAAINMAGDLGDNLRRYRRGGGDRFRWFNLRVAHFKPVRQHPFQIDQHAVEHREERRIVEIVVVNLTALVGKHHIARQQMLAGVMFGDDTGQQVALGRDDFTVFVGIFVKQGRVGLLNQTANFLVQAAAFFTLDIAVVAIFDIGPGQLFPRP